MKKISIIYWSDTGNTEIMAKAIEEGLEDVQIELLTVGQASIDSVLLADGVALGCPSMGAEVLEEEEMEPFITLLEKEDLKGKPMILFGSYGWGNGEWMQDWETRMKDIGVNLIDSGLILEEEPNEEGILQCKELAMRLAAIVNNK